jgi:hypothetical protein
MFDYWIQQVSRKLLWDSLRVLLIEWIKRDETGYSIFYSVWLRYYLQRHGLASSNQGVFC